jgi:hypothetical protein
MPLINSLQRGGASDFLRAVRQNFDMVFWVTLGVLLLISAAAFVVMRLYMRAIFRQSQRSASPAEDSPSVEDGPRPPLSTIAPLEIQIEKSGGPTRPSPMRSSTFQHAENVFRRAPRVYALGGSIYAAVSTGLLFLVGFYSLPSTPSRLTMLACYASVFWSWFFPTMVGLALFWGPDRRVRGLIILAYLGLLPLAGVLLQLAGAPSLPLADLGLMDTARETLSASALLAGKLRPLIQPFLFWLLTVTPWALPLLAFNRFIRGTVGPLFMTLALMMVLSTLTIIDLINYASAGNWLGAHIEGTFGSSTYGVLMVMSITVSGVITWFGLRWLADRYRRRQLSDQTFLFDALWLSVSLWLSVYLMGVFEKFGYWLGLLPFLLYKITVKYGLRPLAARAEPLPKARLLFLRVFGSSSRSEKLLDLLAARWRYAGSIQLISATDVARGRFEPDEFLDFISGRLARSYISSGADLDRRLAGLDHLPDPDGRYRVNEFFCRADTWQQTVTRLMAQSDLVVMDLRAFTSEKKGVLFELGALIDVVPLHRVVLLIDQTTDQPLLTQTLAHLWPRMNPQSPNASGGTARVRIIDLAGGRPIAVRRLLQIGDEVMRAAA